MFTCLAFASRKSPTGLVWNPRVRMRILCIADHQLLKGFESARVHAHLKHCRRPTFGMLKNWRMRMHSLCDSQTINFQIQLRTTSGMVWKARMCINLPTVCFEIRAWA